MERPHLLIVEDQEAIGTQLRWTFAKDYEVAVAPDGKVALHLFEELRPPLVTLDLGLPPDPQGTSEGLRLLSEIIRKEPKTKVIVITGNGEEAAALEAIRLGALDYYHKPIDVEELWVILRRAAHIHRLEQSSEVKQREAEIVGRFEDLLGASSRMQELFSLIERVAASNTTVLITGESGTGKELIARAIHLKSPRREGPFVPINGGAIPETLLESELFGHEKGAFTGAHIRRQGRVEQAHGGTLFLDEVGELPLALQVKLLRFLQEREIERVGGRERIAVDVRVIAATNSDLGKAMAEGRFREDLYYRLSVVTLAVPPLRERGEDVLLLANALLRRFRQEVAGKRIRGFSPEALAALRAHPWPGNVRELENRVQRAVIVATGPLITPEDLELAPLAAKELTLRVARQRVERELVVEALVRSSGNVTRAAREIEVTRPTFHALMNKFGLRTKEFRR
ncbi:MAG: PEP-CTERM-box response regulator transcription factor [Candidatus Rokuibacteriota bacterium]